MAERGGDAVVNLVVRTQTFDVAAYACAFVPVIPCSVAVWMEGDVVRVSTLPARADAPGNGRRFHVEFDLPRDRDD
jgi:hypothetical protein